MCYHQSREHRPQRVRRRARCLRHPPLAIIFWRWHSLPAWDPPSELGSELRSELESLDNLAAQQVGACRRCSVPAVSSQQPPLPYFGTSTMADAYEKCNSPGTCRHDNCFRKWWPHSLLLSCQGHKSIYPSDTCPDLSSRLDSR